MATRGSPRRILLLTTCVLWVVPCGCSWTRKPISNDPLLRDARSASVRDQLSTETPRLQRQIPADSP